MRLTNPTAIITYAFLGLGLQGCPSQGGCPSCPQLQATTVQAATAATHEAHVKAEKSYYAEFATENGSGELDISGPVEALECQDKGKRTYCTFKATADGKARLGVQAGEDGLTYKLNFDRMKK